MLTDGYHDVPKGKLATVVTYLEMRAPVPLRKGMAPTGLALQLEQKPDLEWYRDLFNRVGGHDWLWFSRLKMDDKALSDILNNERNDIFSLRKDGQAEGLLELDFRVQGQCELAFFGVTSVLIGQGAGRFLMNQAIKRAWEQPITRFHVHTCTLDHPDALAFYIRSGFTPTHQQIEIEDDPRITGDFPITAGPRTPIIP